MLKKIIAILLIISTLFCFTQCTQSSTGTPTIKIYTSEASGAATINAGSKDTKYNCKKVLINGEHKSMSFSDVELKGRGNSTWETPNLPKKPYQIKFKKSVSLFGMAECEKWVLLANCFDSTSLRNKIVFDAAKEIGLAAPDSVFVELYINDEYLGVYQLCEKVNGDMVDLEGEYSALCEIDNLYGLNEEEYYCLDISGAVVVPKDTKSDTDAGYLNLVKKLNEIEYDLTNNASWEKLSSEIDVDNWIKYYFIQELTQNRDCLKSSTFCYCNGKDDTVHLGPVWDYDLSLGSTSGNRYEGDPTSEYIRIIHTLSTKNLNWFSKLFEYPEFCERTAEVYAESVRPVFEGISDKIDEYLDVSFITSIAENNSLYANSTGTLPATDEEVLLNYRQEVEELTEFITARTEWLSSQYTSQ